MWRDPIVEEIRAVRERLAAEFDFDISRIIAAARERQNHSGRQVVSFTAAAVNEGERDHETKGGCEVEAYR